MVNTDETAPKAIKLIKGDSSLEECSARDSWLSRLALMSGVSLALGTRENKLCRVADAIVKMPS